MNEHKKGWKVVRVSENGQLVSSTGNDCNERSCRVYGPDIETTPHEDCGPLCVFASLEAARAWWKPLSEQIWECLYVPSSSLAVWNTPKSEIWFPLPIDRLPQATRLADSVTLTKRVTTDLFVVDDEQT